MPISRPIEFFRLGVFGPQRMDMHQRLIESIQKVASDRHKLIILLGDFNSGKTAVMKDVADEMRGTYLNLNLELTEQLLTLPRSKYADGVTVHQLIDEICDKVSPDRRPIFVDNLEILFSPELGKINPVDTFKRISRERVVVLALPARQHGGYLEYSQMGREDHMQMSIEEYIVLQME